MKKNFAKYKMFIIAGGFLLMMVLIFSLNSSGSRSAVAELKACQNKEAVAQCWDKWIDKISSTDGKEKFAAAVKKKLSKENLSDNEIAQWHKKFRAHVPDEKALNIIVIPDLSNRLVNIPNTEKNDIEIISEIYSEFFEKAKTNKSKDKLMIEVTDEKQASGFFRDIAENLSIDLTDRVKERSRDYLTAKEKTFKKDIRELYAQAMNNISGADYVYYFYRRLPDRIRKSDIYTEYENKIIILTDGYLETPSKNYTPVSADMKSSVNDQSIADMLKDKNLLIPNSRVQFPNTQILVLEVNEREDGILWHKEVLAEYWRAWFKSMGIKNITETSDDFFRLKNDNINETKKIVRDFLKS